MTPDAWQMLAALGFLGFLHPRGGFAALTFVALIKYFGLVLA